MPERVPKFRKGFWKLSMERRGLHLGVFGFGLPEVGDVEAEISPESEEVPISTATHCPFTRHSIGTSKLNVSDSTDRFVAGYAMLRKGPRSPELCLRKCLS
jgi:hypothetical protein